LAGNRAHPDHAVDDRADRCGALRLLALVDRCAGALGISVSFGTGGTFALVPLLFPDRPGIAAGFIGGISTVGGIAYPLIFASVNARVGYLYVALYMFAPFILFYFWAARYERHLQEHGLLGGALIGQRF
jgi:NNP family nitrate/nitrite transporter-like MFS transporter